MTPRLRAFSLPLMLSLLFAVILPSGPAAAQGTVPETWRTGASAVSDSFSRDEGQWTLDAGRNALRTIARGRLTVRIPEPALLRWSTLDAGDGFRDFYLEVDTRLDASVADATLGVIFRYVDIDNFYAFLITEDGAYALLKYVDGEVDRPIEWRESAALETGEGAENVLAVLTYGRELAIFANGDELDRVEDRSFTEGRIALVAATNEDGGLVASFDNFALWNKPEAADHEPAVGRKSLRRSTPTPRAADAPDAIVTTESLNVRDGPGMNYPIIATLKEGDGVKVAGRSEDRKWAKLAFTDVTEAWASAQYLRFEIDFSQVPVVKAPPPPAASPKPPGQTARKDVAWLVVENHIGRFITLQVNNQDFRVEGKVGETPGRFRFELQGVGRYRVAAQLPNGGSHNWDLYVEADPSRCMNRQGCVALGQTFLQTYY